MPFEINSPIKNILSFTFILLILVQSQTPAGEPGRWNDLTTGPYAAGFMTIEKYDCSRAFQVKNDYFGAPLPGERARPLQIIIWYPAVKTANAVPAVYGAYAFAYPEDERFVSILSNFHNREIGYLSAYIRDRGKVMELMSTPMSGIRDATPATPPDSAGFPLIIYHAGESHAENAALCEYLASHGFVVATTPNMGSFQYQLQRDPADQENLIRDREFILTQVYDLSFVDHNRLGVCGYLFGGSTALLMQMRNSDVDAVAALEGGFVLPDFIGLTRQSPAWDANRAHVPLMLLYGDTPAPDLSVFDSLTYAKKYIVRLAGFRGFDLSGYGLMALPVGDTAGPPPEMKKAGYAAASRYLLNFFNAYLNKNQESFQFLSSMPAELGFDTSLVTLSFREGADLPPSETQFMNIILDYGIDKGVEIYEKFKNRVTPGRLFREAQFNALGYQLLQTGQTDQAVQIFRMNAETFPHSANVWDSFGEACAAAGDVQTAVSCYKKVLEVLPGDANLDEQTKGVLRSNAENYLGRSGPSSEQ
ncbi:MAG: dienelactone hydrolase family protein [Candidatus Zixiibacteriota bacterium]